MSFGESVSPIAAIQAILHDYPYSASILRELLQNSDDAGATKQIFVLDNRDNPALIAYNDAQFRDADWQSIQSIHQSSKKADTSKIGKYGVGFRACYHITDGPQILSGSSFAVLDPLHSNGMKIDYDKFRTTDYSNSFDFFSDLYEPTSFPGTAIRLPLRSSPSDLSQRTVPMGELRQMVTDYIAEEMNVSLLFLDKLQTIEIWEYSANGKTSLAVCTKSKTTPPSNDQLLPFVTYDTVLSSGDTQYSWRIVQTQSSEDDALSRLSKLANTDSVNQIIQKHKLRSDVRIAYPISSTITKSILGRLFTFLPLPSKTGFPVHIHALFALTSSRQSLRNCNETGIVPGSDNDVLIKWNRLLFEHYIPQAWSRLLKSLAESEARGSILAAWPPRCASITSGDGVYWQNVLQKTYQFVIESGLKVWPKVSTQGTSYVDLRSSLIIPRGQVDVDTLSILSELCLTLVELPQDLIELADSSITRLTPGAAHIELRGQLDKFSNLSRAQRAVVSHYLTSDHDIRKIFGLPLLPLLNKSFISLDERRKSSTRFLALESDEIAVFNASAGDAIPLHQLDPKVAALIREQGPNQANVDLLSPQSVVGYLSKETQPFTDARLTDFWTWLGVWHSKSELVGLLKVNPSLCLIPTSNGPCAASSPVFAAMQDSGNSLLFGKLGLAFITSAMPPSATQLLKDSHILKDPNNLDDVLAAISLIHMPSLTSKEAESIFHYMTAYYGPLSPDSLKTLRQLPVFPVLVPERNTHGQELSNCSTTWRSISDISVNDIAPMKLIPVVEKTHFLDASHVRDSSSLVMKKLAIQLITDEAILSHALQHFASQPKALQVAFVSYIKHNRDRLPSTVTKQLQGTRFLQMGNILRSPDEIIDPNSPLASLFSRGKDVAFLPKVDDDCDRQLFGDLQTLGLMKTRLSADMIYERISFISSNTSSPEANAISSSLLALMNDASFSCSGLTIDPNMHWLPTKNGLASSTSCINGGRRDTDLFDKVLLTLDSSISISPSFKALLNWDKPLLLTILTGQLDQVLEDPAPHSLPTKIRKIRNIIRELAGRRLGTADIQAIELAIDGRSWIPTKTGSLAPHSRAVFAPVPGSSGFYEIGFSTAEQEIHHFLIKMGCQERPTATAIIEELTALRGRPGGKATILQAIRLLEMLPNNISEAKRASLLIPEETGSLVPLTSGICYYSGSGQLPEDGKGLHIAHHLVTEELAEKLKMDRLGLEGEDDVELGEKPVTTIRNTLRQYDPQQFFTEFIANASDAKATRFELLIDDHKGPTGNVFSEGMKIFQNASLVVYNNGVFTSDDFIGIRQTGIGGKRGKPNMIGRFGLGALSMFHFTELAMIVSGSYVLFINPAKQHLAYRGKNSVLLPLQRVKSLYTDHLKPLDGLFGFDLSSEGPYQGTLFRLPLRTQAHLSHNSVSTTSWNVEDVQDMLLAQFDNLAYKSLLFTNINHIGILARQNSHLTTLRTIESTRAPDNLATDAPSKAEVTTFQTSARQERWLILSMPVNVPTHLKKTLAKKYDMHHFLPVQIAAALDTQNSNTEYNLFCSLPLPIKTSLPVHISAPLILEQERRNLRLDNLGQESEYNHWILSSEIPRLYVFLLERILQNEGTNAAWWPGIGSSSVDNAASQAIIKSFWAPGMLGTSLSRIFAVKYRPGLSLAPAKAILFSEDWYMYTTISKIVALSKPVNVVEVPSELRGHVTTAELRILDETFIRDLLKDPHVCQQLSHDEIKAVLSYLTLPSQAPSLCGLSLIPLEDGSLARISEQSESTKTYYVYKPAPKATYPPFRKDRLIHHQFTGQKYLLDRGYNVSKLSESGIVELAEECIQRADEISGDEAHKAWVTAFWSAQLIIPLDKLTHLPLIPTLKPFYFISLRKVDDISVIVVSEETGPDEFNYNILQKLGMTIIVKQGWPSALQEYIAKKKHSIYNSFLKFMRGSPEQLALFQRLDTSDHKRLSKWIRPRFEYTAPDLAETACKLPVWPVHPRGGGYQLSALNDVTILPHSMPSDILRPFTERPVIDWKEGMKSVKKKPCDVARIPELLRIFPGYLLRPTEQTAYRDLLEHLLDLGEINNYTVLVPNERLVLTRASDLFERHELFMAAFESASHHLLSGDFQDLRESLKIHGLKCRSRLDLLLFIKCASAFDQDKKRSKRARSVTLYRYFNSLSLSYRDSSWCSQLDDLKFIPRVDSRRPEYGDINTIDYMADLPQDVLSPSQITLPKFEPICWSQKGRTDPPPNPTLCATYQALGKPIGVDVVEHLKVLVEIGKKYGYRAGLLSDLTATYEWLNDNVEDIRHLIVQENTEPIFLNVNNPKRDEWVWHSASTIVIGLRDIYDLRDVKHFLGKYKELLEAAGVRKIQKVKAEAIPPTDKTSHFREKFTEMRRKGRGTDITFEARDSQHQVLPAHGVWLSANSKHFWETFIASDFQEAQQLGVGETVIRVPEEFSSLCAMEVIDWIYTGELPKSITDRSDSDEESKTKLELALDMLALADYWQVLELHEYLQTFIINAPDFINPYWAKRIRENAESAKATQLIEACNLYEKDNLSIIEEYPDRDDA